MTLLLRTLRRITSLEESLGVFAKLNFGSRKDGETYDLHLSVYELNDKSEVTQAHTEHRASFCNPPKVQEPSLSLEGFPGVDVRVTPGTTKFAFTQKQHREMNFFDDDEVLAIAEVVRAQVAERQLFTTPEAMWDYIERRLQSDDPEWMKLCSGEKTWKKWVQAPPRQIRIPEI